MRQGPIVKESGRRAIIRNIHFVIQRGVFEDPNEIIYLSI